MTTLLGTFRRVAYIEDFHEILTRIHSVERCHMGYKKTLNFFNTCTSQLLYSSPALHQH